MSNAPIRITDLSFYALLNGLMVCCLLLFVAGLVTLSAAYPRARSKGWPTATGVVVAAALRMDFHKPPHAPYYKPFVCYTYNVGDGVPRANTTINYSDSPPR